MKLFFLSLSFLLLSTQVGCTSFQPVNMSTADLQQKLSQGKIINKGDSIQVQTSSGQTTTLVVSKVSPTDIYWQNQKTQNKLPINSITQLSKKQLNKLKTGLLIGVGVAVAAALLINKVADDITTDVTGSN